MDTLAPYQKISRSGSQPDTKDFLAQLTGSGELGIQGRGFSLNLGDGNRWWIGSSPRAAPLAETLAYLMHLEEGDPDEDPFIYFYEKNTDQPHLELSRFQAQGWINLYPVHFQIWFHPRRHHVLCGYDAGKRQNSIFPLLAAAVHTMQWDSISRGCLPFHGALLEHKGQGVILAAPGGTGKSTCSRRVFFPWRARCDDEILVVPAPAGGYLAHPFPTWTDYLWERAKNTWKVAEAIPLAGLFFLEQTPEDEIIPLAEHRAAVAVAQSAEEILSFHLQFGAHGKEIRDLKLNILDNACALVKQIPAFRLRVSLTGKFWEKIEAALDWN